MDHGTYPEAASPGHVSAEGVAARAKNLRLAYERASSSHENISDFRAKLLGLLPLATGAGAFVLLDRQDTSFLGPIGVFGVAITLGLFMYELRGIQRCLRLERQAAFLEEQLGLHQPEGSFTGSPPRLLKGMLGPPGAGLIVYLTVVFAWLYVAGVGFGWWDENGTIQAWILVPAYLGVVAGGWKLLEWRLREWHHLPTVDDR